MNSSVIRIAWRNLWEHKSKTLILGFLIAFGVLLIISANSFLNASEKNMESLFRENYTGDILVHAKSKYMISLFGASSIVSAGSLPTVPVLPDTPAIIDIVSALPETQSVSTAISGIVQIKATNIPDSWEPAEENESIMLFNNFIAGNPTNYFEMFPSVTLTEGTYPSATEATIIIAEKTKANYEKYYEKPLAIGDKVILESYGEGNKIREVSVAGFFNPSREDSSITDLIYIDQNTARALNSITLGSTLAWELPESIDTTLTTLSDDDLFGSDSSLFDINSEAVFSGNLSATDVDSILGDTTQRDILNQTANEAWNFVQVQLHNASDAPRIIAQLNAYFASQNMPITAINWKTAGSGYAQIADMLGGVFGLLMGVLAVVIFIVIMNTLIVSIIERVGEIGTMRAIGSSRNFIRSMFFVESISITTIASALGIVLSLIITIILNTVNITIENETAKMFLGGNTIHLVPSLGYIITTFAIVLFVGIAANIYPVSVALRISPLRAMNSQV